MRDRMTRRRAVTIQTLTAVFTLAAFFISVAPSARADETQTYDLRPHGKPGQITRYEIWSKRSQIVTASFGGHTRTSRFSMTSEGEATWRINKVKPDGSMTCTMTLDWLTLNYTDDDGKKHENDSRKSKGDFKPFHALLKAMCGVPMKVTVAPDGTVTDVDGVKVIASRIKTEFKEMVPDKLDFVETASELATLIAVPRLVEVGKQWDADVKWTWANPPFEGFMHHDATFTLSAVEELAGVQIAVIDGKSKLKLELDKSELPDGMPPYTVKLVKGNWQSQIMFDLSRNETVGRNAIQTTTIDVTLRMPNATMTRRIEQTLQGQVLRIEEK